jgi:hypothetical protein
MTSKTRNRRKVLTPQCARLAETLGYKRHSSKDTADPYLLYIISKSNETSNCELEDFLWLFSEIITPSTAAPTGSAQQISALSSSIACIIEKLEKDVTIRYFKSRSSASRRKHVEDAVFLILGLWSMMERNFKSSFYQSTDSVHQERPIILAYNARKVVLNRPTTPICSTLGTSANHTLNVSHQAGVQCTLAELIAGSGFIITSNTSQSMFSMIPATGDPNQFVPSSRLESVLISAQALNLSKLYTLAGVHIQWTDNLSRHLLLSTRGGISYVELFAYPCALDSETRGLDNLRGIGVPLKYMNEIRKSYANLFNPVDISVPHRMLNVLGVRHVCWCLACTSYRLMAREFRGLELKADDDIEPWFFDPALKTLSTAKRGDWNEDSYSHLWSRIVILQDVLRNAKPWSFWVLFRDRREKLPFWTFL